MKRKLVVSWALVIAMLLCMAPAGFAAEDAPYEIMREGEDNPTLFGGDGAIAGSIVTNDELNGGKSQKIDVNLDKMPVGGAGLEYQVDAEKAGLYLARVRTTRQGRLYFGDAGINHDSPYYVQINDGVPFTYREGSAYEVTGKGHIMPLNKTERANYAEYEFPVYLNQGQNTIRFIVKTKRNSANSGVFHLDYFKLTYQSPGAAYQPLLVNGGDCLDTNAPAGGITLADNANGGKGIALTTSETADGGYFLNYAVTTALGGRYVMEFTTSAQGQQGTGVSADTSPYTIAINDNEIAFPSFNGFKVEEAGGRTKYRMEVGLNAGVNTVNFNIGACSGGNTVFCLDDMRFLPVNESNPDDFKVEGESFTSAGVAGDANNGAYEDKRLSNEKAAYFENETSPVLNYTFWVDKAGEYALYPTCGNLVQQMNGDTVSEAKTSSYFTVQVNGGAAINVDDSAAKLGDMLVSGGKDYNAYAVKSTLVPLEKGWNTMQITPTEQTDGGYKLALDYIRFAKAETNIKVGPYSSIVTLTDVTMTDDGQFPMVKNQATPSDYVGHFPFFVSEEGDYTLTMEMACEASKDMWYAPTGISFDDEVNYIQLVSQKSKDAFDALTEAEKKGQTRGEVNTEIIASNIYGLGDLFGRLEYMPSVHLTKGWHTFRIKTMGTSMKGNGTPRHLYYLGMSLKKDQTLGSGTLYLDNPVLTAGEQTTAQVTLFADNGALYTETPEDLSFVSSDENVAEVAPDGTITAWNAGKSTITACVGSVTCEADVIVLGDGSSVVLHSAEANPTGETVKVRIASVGPQPAGTTVQILAVAYGKSGDVSTSLKAIDVQNVADLTSGQTSDLTFDLPGLQADDTVKVFVWDDMSNMIPLWTSTVAE